MNNLMYTAHSNYENIVKLINDKSSSISSFNDEIDMDLLFPITNDNELRALENKIKDTEFRLILVIIISFTLILYFSQYYLYLYRFIEFHC
jgi:hypothetical protein